MPTTVSKTSSEWIVAKVSSVSVCISVENGEIHRAQLNGLQNDPIYIDERLLPPLSEALTEALQEARASKVRTMPSNPADISENSNHETD